MCVDSVFNTYNDNIVYIKGYGDELDYIYDSIYNTCFIKRFYTRTIDEFVIKHKKIIKNAIFTLWKCDI